MEFLERLSEVSEADVCSLQVSERSYGDSWKRRGGVGAFMMLARKWDRLENALSPREDKPYVSKISGVVVPYDIFGAISADNREEGIIDDIRDLRRYLMLVEAEMISRGAFGKKATADKSVRIIDQGPVGQPGFGKTHKKKAIDSRRFNPDQDLPA